MIDWSELEPYENNIPHSFEVLCYQIAKGLHGENGRFTSVDDSGGGDGVEFYLTLPNGDQWGWQAKFYHPEPRLSKSNRKGAIEGSLKKACEVHPRLKKWFLCTPTNFTPDEQKWFDNTLRQSISEDIEIKHWGDSDFNNWLSEPRFSGKLNYFFGELELNLDWFKGQFKKQMAGIGDKFDSSLHTETNADVEHPNHPFNASFWSDRLLARSMSERDLSWTEYVRRNRYSLEEIVTHFEETCRDAQNISDYGKKRLLLFAEYIMWILTSTVRPLRDQATRALYWYGRRFPQDFFDLVTKSFTINDTYVSERRLAATYGIAMAGQNDFKDITFVKEMLPLYARQLYENMFKPDAPYSTTHILARDYARRTIDIALIHHPDLLTKDERERIAPPFTDGGIREWGRREKRNTDESQKGPAPLQMDFENYTLGSLVKGRGNYNFEHDEYKRVRANILWRIYDLGFSSDTFGEIDDWLIGENYRKYGRSADGRKTDRYGKKYSWIAFYEFVGFRQDKGLLPDYYENGRISGVDIDQSFPIEERKHNLITKDFLGDREISVEEWIAKTNPPDLTPYLKINDLCKQQGTWVLLQGNLSQAHKKDSRDPFASLQGLIVKPEETEKIVETFMNQEAMDRSNMPFCPEDYYTYAGEVPVV